MSSLNFSLLLLLYCFIGLTWCATTRSTTAAVHLYAYPTSVKEGSTAHLKVNCTLDGLRGSQFDVLSYLTLYKSTSADNTNYKEVAVVSSTGYTVVTKDDLGATRINGVMNAADVSFISFEWENPKQQVSGHYMCEAQGMDKIGHPVTSLDMFTITGGEVDYYFLLQKIHQLNATLQAQSGGSTTNVVNLENKLNDLVAIVNDQKVLLNSQSTQIASLNTKLLNKETEINNQSSYINTLLSEMEKQRDNCNNITTQTDAQVRHLQDQLDNYGLRLDVQVSNQISVLNASISQNSKDVSSCCADVVRNRDLITNISKRLDDVTFSQTGQTLQGGDIMALINNSRDAVMQTSLDFNGKRYYLSRPMWRNMAAFEGMCKLFGGDVVEVDDVAEFDILSQLIQSNNVTEQVIIGGTDQDKEGVWRFQGSGQPMTFFNWAANFPSSSVFENCIMLDANHGWNMVNTYCDAKMWTRAICEMNG